MLTEARDRTQDLFMLRPLATLIACGLLCAGAYGATADWTWQQIVLRGLGGAVLLFCLAAGAGLVARRART